jgi:hypothetical protein
MGKLFRAIVLVAGIGALMSAGGLVTVAPAQDKKDKDAKKDKKDAKATKEEIGATEVYKAKDGWRFRIKDTTTDKSVAIGVVGYDTKEEALAKLDFVKTTLTKGKVDVLKEEKK